MEHKDRIITVAIITGVIALLLGCCLGVMFGVMGGYLIGHQATGRQIEYLMPEVPQMPFTPEIPEMPMLPELLDRQGAIIQEVIVAPRQRTPVWRSVTLSPRSMARRST